MIKLRAAVLHGVRDMRVEEVKEPEVMDGDVFIRVRAASVCGTDAHLYGGELEVEPPMILSHDFRGSSRGWTPGSRTSHPGRGLSPRSRGTTTPATSAGRGGYHLCINSRFMGFDAVKVVVKL